MNEFQNDGIVKFSETNWIAARSAPQNAAHEIQFSVPGNFIHINNQARATSHVTV